MFPASSTFGVLWKFRALNRVERMLGKLNSKRAAQTSNLTTILEVSMFDEGEPATDCPTTSTRRNPRSGRAVSMTEISRSLSAGGPDRFALARYKSRAAMLSPRTNEGSSPPLPRTASSLGLSNPDRWGQAQCWCRACTAIRPARRRSGAGSSRGRMCLVHNPEHWQDRSARGTRGRAARHSLSRVMWRPRGRCRYRSSAPARSG